MRTEERYDGRVQFVTLDSIMECFRLVTEPTGGNCLDPVNAELARTEYADSCDKALDAIGGFMRSDASFAKEVEKARAMLGACLDDLGVTRHKPIRKIRRHLESGDELDPQAFIARRPDGWSEIRKDRRPHMAIKIAVNVSMCYGPIADGRAVSRGAVTAAMCDVLEEIGYSVEITLYDVTSNAGAPCHTYVVEVPIKSMSAPLDVNQIAYMGSCPDFIRSVVYPIQARVLRGRSNYWGGPGAVPGWIAATQDIMMDRVHTMEDAADLVKKYADKLKSK